MRVAFDAECINALFARFDRCDGPGAAVGIAIDGTPVYRQTFGLASVELPLCLTPATRLRIGSATKSFASLACMLLCEEGRASPDDPIGKFLPELSAAARRPTLRQIMGNISGLRDALGLISQFRGHLDAHVGGRPTTAEEVFALYCEMQEVNAPPAATFIYNNGAFLLLTLAIERIAGQSFADVISGRICQPLGLWDTQVRPWDTTFLANSASTHQLVSPQQGTFARALFGYDYAGGGAIVSTLDDMLRWLANMKTHAVGNAVTWSAMTTPQRLTNGTSSGYGMGLRTGRYRGVETIFHGGGWVGSQMQMLKVADAALDIVILANRNDIAGPALLDQMLDCLLPTLEPARPRFAGPFINTTFHSNNSARIVQLYESTGRQRAVVDGWDVAVEPDEHGTFWPPDKHGFMKWGFMPCGSPTELRALRLSDFGAVEELPRVQPASGAWPRDILGHFQSTDTGFEAQIQPSAQGVRLTTSTRFGSITLDLEWLGEHLWRTHSDNSMDAVLVFDRGWQSFRYSDAFTRALCFQRCA